MSLEAMSIDQRDCEIRRPKLAQFAALILAAGASRRLGRPKQLLVYHGKTLLQHIVAKVLQLDADSTLVVLGYAAPEVQRVLAEFSKNQLRVIVNPEWEEGMASSIRAGIIALQRSSPGCPGVLLLVCDQPALGVAHLNRLLTLAREQPAKIAASRYSGGGVGVPAYFPAKYFSELSHLQGEEGARSLLKRHADEVVAESLGVAEIDIDTLEDWQKLLLPGDPDGEEPSRDLN